MAISGKPVYVACSLKNLTECVRQCLPGVEVHDLCYTREDGYPPEQANRLHDVEILLCHPRAVQLNAMPNLKWAQTATAGVDPVLKALDYKKPAREFLLTRTLEGFGSIMAEYVVGHIISQERDFMGIATKQQQKQWAQSTFNGYRILSSLTIALLGYGGIGQEVARICKTMGMTVWAVTRSKGRSSSPYVDHFRREEELPEVLSNCDYVCNILPATPATRNLLSGDVLHNCKVKKSVLINIGRGNVISDDSLIRAVREGWLGGAILDVFNTEPLPPESPLWSLPGVTITPHVSNRLVPEKVSQAFAENYRRFQAGEDLKFAVDWDRGY